jgi:hypothetical protein
MPALTSELPETRERRCPACQSEAIAPTGHVSASGGMIHVQHRCEACGLAFVFVRKALI